MISITVSVIPNSQRQAAQLSLGGGPSRVQASEHTCTSGLFGYIRKCLLLILCPGKAQPDHVTDVTNICKLFFQIKWSCELATVLFQPFFQRPWFVGAPYSVKNVQQYCIPTSFAIAVQWLCKYCTAAHFNTATLYKRTSFERLPLLLKFFCNHILRQM